MVMICKKHILAE